MKIILLQRPINTFPKTLLVCSVRQSVPRYSQVREKKKQNKQSKKQNKTQTKKKQKNREAKMIVVQRSEKQSLYNAKRDIVCSTKMHAQTSLFN